jgi:hypothetical protein
MLDKIKVRKFCIISIEKKIQRMINTRQYLRKGSQIFFLTVKSVFLFVSSNNSDVRERLVSQPRFVGQGMIAAHLYEVRGMQKKK